VSLIVVKGCASNVRVSDDLLKEVNERAEERNFFGRDLADHSFHVLAEFDRSVG
jgi:hypothetical protein